METPNRNIKRKILFVITKSNWGGAQSYVYDLATSIDKDIFEAEVIVGGNGLLAHKLEAAGIPVASLHSMERDINIKKELLSAIELFKLFRKTKPDVIHLNSSKAGGLGAVAARLAGARKIIFTAHAWAFNENRGLFSNLLISFLHWVTVILSHQTIAVSESVREQVIHMPFMKKKIEVVHLGIEPFECKEKEEARKLLKERAALDSSGILWIGAISELHPIKGLLYALDAINLLKETYPALQFYIIGEGEQRSLIEKQIIKRKLEGQVHLVGFIDDAKTYLKAFDIFVLPSLSEAFGYSLLEAGNAEIPIIASNVGGIPEVIDEAGILTPSKNARAIADAITKLIESPEERMALGKAMNHRVHTIFTKEKMIAKTSVHY
jgi:glycosyltransferase involved in cell wall biosynthesis